MATLQDYLGITALRDAWPKWKANIIAVNNQVINHVAGTADKHAAQDITYSGNFTSMADVKAALDQAKTEIDTIVISASIDPEVAFARESLVKAKTFGTLDARLEESEQDFVSAQAETAKYYTPEMFGGTDWIACQKAVDEACKNGGGIVIFQDGETYTVDSHTIVVWGSNVTLIGYGAIFSRFGSLGYYGDVISFYGLQNNLEYYGYLNGGDYTSRTPYLGTQSDSLNIVMMGFQKFIFNPTLDGTACNAISGLHCQVRIIDCYVENAPQTSYAFPVTGDAVTDVYMENCFSKDCKGHAFRITVYDMTENTKIRAVLKNCGATGTAGTTNLFPEISGYLCDLYLRGGGIGERFNVSIENCNFSEGVYHPNSSGYVTSNNLTCKWYIRTSGSADTTLSDDTVNNIKLTGSKVMSGYTTSMYLADVKGSIKINGLQHPFSSDATKYGLVAYSIESLSVKNMLKGNVVTSTNKVYIQNLSFEDCYLYSVANVTFLANAGSKITLSRCSIDLVTSLVGVATVNYIVKNCKILRKGNSSGYWLIRAIGIGSLTDNEMIITSPASSSEQLANPSSTIVVDKNLITQLDLTKIIDYGGKSVGTPSAGYHVVGQYVQEQVPIPGGYMGYVCTTLGAPGTWKGYGLIQA